MLQKSSYIIGLDIGGNKIGGGLIKSGKIIKRIKVPTESKRGAKQVLKNIIKTIKALDNKKVTGIGLGLAGQIDYKKDVFLGGPNLPKGLKNIPFKKIIQKKFKIPAKLENDAHCFTLAENIYGAARGCNNVLGITLGTGIGGGLCLNKQIYHGRDNITLEVGHITLDSGADMECSCRLPGHFEALASGTAMIKWYKKFTGKTRDTFFIEKEAIRSAPAGKKVIKKMSFYLGLGLSNLIHLFNPEIIVVGGGIIRIKMLWLPTLRETKKKIVFPMLLNTKIVKTNLGDDAPILGASLLIKNIK